MRDSTQVVCLQYLTQGLLASDHTSLLSQPTAEVGCVCSVSETRDGHVVILPSALEVIPRRAHKAQFTGLVINYSLEFNLDEWLALWAGVSWTESGRLEAYFTLFRDAVVKVFFVFLHPLA